MEFSPFPFEPTNLSAVGMLDNALEDRVRKVVDKLSRYGTSVPADLVAEKLQEYDIPYSFLPQYLIDLIDTIDIY